MSGIAVKCTLSFYCLVPLFANLLPRSRFFRSWSSWFDNVSKGVILWIHYTIGLLYLFFRYLVADVQCTFSTVGSDIEDLITATLKRPAGFKGSPMFADDRIGVKEPNPHCIISRDTSDEDDRTYSLRINDFTRCGVLKRNVSTLERFSIIHLLNLYLSQRVLFMCAFGSPNFPAWSCNQIRNWSSCANLQSQR